MSHPYTAVQLDALRELTNIASGTAATALSQLLGREVELSVPVVRSLPLLDALQDSGSDEDALSGVAIPVEGDFDAVMLMLIPPGHGENLCRLLGLDQDSELADSALREVGNILGAAYLGAIGSMTGLSLFPMPPQLGRAGLGGMVAGALEGRPDAAEAADAVLMLDSELEVADDVCSVTFLLLPTTHSTFELLALMGLGERAA